MKVIVAALLLVSVSAFAAELDATEALLNTLPEGDYVGRTEKNEVCTISVLKLAQEVIVKGTSPNMTQVKNIKVGSVYRWNPGTRNFLSSDALTTNEMKVTSTFRTIAVTENTQYVIVAKDIESQRSRYTDKVECIIEL